MASLKEDAVSVLREIANKPNLERRIGAELAEKVQSILDRDDTRQRGAPRKADPEEVFSLAESGMRMSDIADQLGIGKTAVYAAYNVAKASRQAKSH